VSGLGTVSWYVLLIPLSEDELPDVAIASADTAIAQNKNTFFMVRYLIYKKLGY
jgi:hypothetical protein